MDITRTGCVRPSSKSRTEVTTWLEEVDVIGPNEGLGQAYNGLLQRGLAMVIRSLLRHITSQLNNLLILDQVSLEAREHDLALARLEPVNDGWD